MVSILGKAKLGEILVWMGYVRPCDLETALLIQNQCPNLIGETLICQGYITRSQLEEALDTQAQAHYVDLIEHQSTVIIESDNNRWDYMRHGCIPWRKDPHELTIATSRYTPAIKHWAEKCFSVRRRIRFVLARPQHIFENLRMSYAKADIQHAVSHLTTHHQEFSFYAWYHQPGGWIGHHSMLLMCVFTSLIIFFLLFPCGIFFFFLAVMNVFYLVMLGSKLYLMLKRNQTMKAMPIAPSLLTSNKPSSASPSHPPLSVSLIIPLRDEAAIIPQLLRNLQTIDFPLSHLQILIPVEADDASTIEALHNHLLPPHIIPLYVPPSIPRTKGKACNFALHYVIHDLVGIFDADDLIDPQHLNRVVMQFAQEPTITAAIQCRLNYYNAQQNWLTRMFSLEYTLWFDYLLPGLWHAKAPIPLGGSSNFFRTMVLREIGAWDPYNVTEDADIGVRLARLGYRTALSKTLTLEEAPLHLRTWLKQRSRWIKGHLQTYLVHMQSPDILFHHLGFKGFLWLNLFIGLPCIGHMMVPILWLAGIGYPMLSHLFHFPDLPLVLHRLTVAVLGIGLILQAFMAWCAHPPRHIKDYLAIITFPFYWLLHAIAAFIAFIELIHRPFHWNKTPHAGCRTFIESKRKT
ncbi:MAG: glycosyltransferase [Alphaproteobacteria bacterium]|nr:glycosyltransferase [Alphaproteobacteria bacterium]